ncbi:MAG: hypothetical protein OXU64_04105 [Gemmatimonadota bacterium]|nr:hypothetical protein [Gemmatimonadota bacterium]
MRRKRRLRLGVLAGVRGELIPIPSPGYSLDLILDLPEVPIWLSLQFLHAVYDHQHMRRVRLGYRNAYALSESGGGVVEGGALSGDAYDMAGVGLGGGTSFGRFTASLDAVLGVSTLGDHGPYIRVGPQLQYRVPLPSYR